MTMLGLPVGACLSCLALAAGQQLSGQGEIVRGPIDEKQLALVFTGHEFAEGGDAILSALSRRKARASFFLTGDFLRRPEFAPLVERIVALKRAMVNAATQRYLLVDHTKLGRVALHRVVPLDEFDLIITDSGADPAVLEAWNASGTKYRAVPTSRN